MTAAAATGATTGAHLPEGPAAFTLEVPAAMATGRITLRARADDPRVRSVIWTVGGLTRRSARPLFDAEFEVGQIPEERKVLAVAVDDEGQALNEQETVLNPGERAVAVEILSLLQGQKASGRIPVVVRARLPEDETIARLTLDAGHGPEALPGTGDVRTATVEIPDRTTPLTASLVTAGGRTAGRTIVLNGRGVQASSEGRIVDQMVGVYRGKEPLERITGTTGGRTIRVRKAEELPGFFTEIERDIRMPYLVSYVPNVKRTGSFHAVTIRTRKGRVQTLPGFFY